MYSSPPLGVKHKILVFSKKHGIELGVTWIELEATLVPTPLIALIRIVYVVPFVRLEIVSGVVVWGVPNGVNTAPPFVEYE
jgi:hypothetical protein